MNGQSLDITKELLEQLKKVVPQAFSEDKLDVTQLKTLLGEDIFVQNERYGLSWAGKNEAYQVMQQPTIATLEPQPEASIDWDEAQHLFIEGENLEVLKLLQKSYFGKVKMIYIDPPYNTGNDSFIYPDKFSETKEEYLARIGEKSDDGYLMKEGYFRKNSRENGRYHSNWLSMMLPRLYLARNLLRDEGVIFVSIDDNEQANLKLLMDEVFGEENFEALIIVTSNPGGRDYKQIALTSEYLFIYAKNSELLELNEIEKEVDFKFKDCNGGYDLRELRNRNPKFHRENRPNLFYPFYVNPQNNSDGYCSVSLVKDSNYSVEVYPFNSTGVASVWRWGIKKSGENIVYNDLDKSQIVAKQKTDGNWNIYEKNRKATTKVKSVWNEVEMRTENGTRELRALTDKSIFNHPKPIGLIKRSAIIGTKYSTGDIILDFFSGSGTTAQAVMELNEEDNGNRRYICVQLPEKTEETSEAYKAGYKTIAEITQARIQKVIERIKQQRAEKVTLLDEAKPKLGYRKYKLAGSNFKQWRGDIPQTEQEIETLLDKIEQVEYSNAEPQAMLWELLLKNGYSLTEQVKVIQAGNTPIYLTANQHLAIVLEAYNEQVQAQLLTIKPKQVITLDSLFKGQDMAKANYQLKLKDNDIEFKTI